MRKNQTTKLCQCCGRRFVLGVKAAEKQRFCSLECRLSFLGDFMRHADRSAGEDGCWPWLGSDDGQAKYGRASVGGKTRGAHVAVYEAEVGPVPEGLELDHLCRNPGCVNPKHLEPVTRRVNVLRQPKVIAARSATHCANGHEWTAANTYRHPTQGSRICRACVRASVSRYRAQTSNTLHV